MARLISRRQRDVWQVPEHLQPLQCLPEHILIYFCSITGDYTVLEWRGMFSLDRWGPQRSTIVQGSYPSILLALACATLGVHERKFTVQQSGEITVVFNARIVRKR